MNRPAVVLLVAAVSSMVVAWQGQAVAGADCGEPVAPPRYRVGDKWVSRTETGGEISAEVIGLEGDLVQIEWKDPRWQPDMKGTVFIDLEGVIRRAIRPSGEVVTKQGRGRPFELIGQKELDFPLRVGKTWSFSYMSYSTGEMASQHYRVVACEEVSTAAGKFPALRVEREIRFQRFTGASLSWYAPSVKNIIKWEFPRGRGYGGTSIDSELTQFELK